MEICQGRPLVELNNVGIQKLVITFTVLSFDMGILGKKKKIQKQKNEWETSIKW